jgi:membrane-bound lytic murein transglycosylase B
MRWTMAAVLAALVCAVPAVTHAAKKKSAAVRGDDAPDLVTYGRRADVMRFAEEVAQRHGFELAWVEEQLARSRFVPAVVRLIMPPPAGTAKNWAAYRARFVEPQRIRAGAQFWQANAQWLDSAAERFGVPASIVVGILGVETYYGRIMGDFRTLDALATLAFDFPPGRKDRSEFFKAELEQLLVLAQRDGVDLQTLRGSYAGAIGLGQFMPGSVNEYALDFDGDGRVDLHGSSADAIGSVANYLAKFGWQRGMPTHYAVAAPVEVVDRAVLLAPDIMPSFTPAQFAERGAVLRDESARAHEGLLALIELQNGDAAPSYVAGTQNFYAVTRYNWSSYYAMAVIELGAAVAREVGR